jgi:hypothetical protein
MKLFSFFALTSFFLSISSIGFVQAVTDITQSVNNCGNGIFCASSQTCMSNTTGAGLIFACSPLSNAVRCMDARYSCPASYSCAEEAKCLFNNTDNQLHTIDAVLNIDPIKVADLRDFGSGLKPTSLSICGPITSLFRLPNFCSCRDAQLGGELGCTIGIQTYISLGARAWVLPCASPANFGYKVWASTLGLTTSIGNTWTSAFTLTRPIPGASFEIGRSIAGARVEISGDISRFIISTNVAIGVCASINAGPFSWGACNPSAFSWLPIHILNGPRFDFSRFC